jgi:hypothetical protein
VRNIETRLKISSDCTGAWSPVQLSLYADGINGHAWYANCTFTRHIDDVRITPAQ